MTSPTVPATCKVVLAGTIAKDLLAEVAVGLSKLSFKPKLVGFLANEDPDAKMYADWSKKTCMENGFEYELKVLDKEELEEAILTANTDSTVHGIIVYYPIFPATSRQDAYIQQLVKLEKDVEGLCHTYRFNMYQNIRFLDVPYNTQKSILPCTPLAVVKVLEYLQIYNNVIPSGNRLFGRTITVINRSEVVGRPLAALLANDGATVYSVDLDGVQVFTRGQGIKMHRHEVHKKDGWTSKDCLPLSDVVITGVPGKAFKVDMDLVRDGAVCINFSSEKNFDGPAVKEKASIYVPAIGKVTIAVLLRNLLRLVDNQQRSITGFTAKEEKVFSVLAGGEVKRPSLPAKQPSIVSFSKHSAVVFEPSKKSTIQSLKNWWFGFNKSGKVTQSTPTRPKLQKARTENPPSPLVSFPDFDSHIKDDATASTPSKFT